MLRHRVIPCLLISGDGLVKTTEFARPRYVGDPINAVKIFNDKEVDEVCLLDIDASRKGGGPNYRLIEEIASEAFMPVTYGGGVATVEDAERVFALGIEKIAVQTAALADVSVVTALASVFGSSSVVASVDVRRRRRGPPQIYASAQRAEIGQDWLRRLGQLQDAGAGEFLLQAVHRDGTMSGLDLELIAAAAQVLTVPLVAAGGVGSLEDIRAGLAAGADAVAAGAYFVYHGRHRAVLITYPNYDALTSMMEGLG